MHSPPCRLMRSVVAAATLLLAVSPSLAREAFERAFVVPASSSVTIDGHLDDWDMSGAVESFYDDALLPNFKVRIAFMYDDEALYIGAHFVDRSPMMNMHDPDVHPEQGWAGDCLQVRLVSDPSVAYPLERDALATDSERICHLTMWQYTPEALPVLNVEYGMDYHGTRLFTGDDANLAFQKDDDGNGYTLEARVPWSRLNAADDPPTSGDRVGLTVQPIWGNEAGTDHKITFNEIVRHSSHAFQTFNGWGVGEFTSTGDLEVDMVASTDAAKTAPLTLELELPDANARTVSAMLYDQNGRSVRTLPATQRDARASGRTTATLRWDGLDDDGDPVAPGQYQVKLLTHRGIDQEYVTTVYRAGNPPWKTDDGKGAWGGDWSAPVAAASDDKRVYLGWPVSEGGWGVIGVKPALTDDGRPRKQWGQSEGGQSLAAAEGYVFVGRDGMGGHARVIMLDADTGRQIETPFGEGELSISKWDTALAGEPGPKYHHKQPLFKRRQAGNAGIDTHRRRQNLVDIAVRGDRLYASLRYEDRIAIYNWKSGKALASHKIERPAGIALDARGEIIVASGHSLKRLNPRNGVVSTIAADALDHPWDVTLDDAGHIYVANCGRTMRVKVFDPQGRLQRNIGKKGGRPWVGSFEPTGMLMPAGLTVDTSGKLWVMERDDFPRRVSVWHAREGAFISDFHGPGVPQMDMAVNPNDPGMVSTGGGMLYRVNYDTGAVQPISTLWRPHHDDWSIWQGFGRGSRFIFRQTNGRSYAILQSKMSRGADGIFLFNGTRARPVAAFGKGYGFPIVDPEHRVAHRWRRWGYMPDWRQRIQTAQAQKLLHDEKLIHKNRVRHRWVDDNGDHNVQPGEMQLKVMSWQERRNQPRFLNVVHVGDDLTLWATQNRDRRGHLVRAEVQRWKDGRIPIYPDPADAEVICELPEGRRYDVRVDPAAKRFYIIRQIGGSRKQGAEYAAVECYDFNGRQQWAYTTVWPGFALDAPFWQPGYVIGAANFCGQVKLDDGTGLLVTTGYQGMFHCLTTDGQWVARFCRDNRYGPSAGPNTIFTENFTGYFFKNKNDGHVYLMGGDTDCRIWRLTGFDSIRTATQTITITERDHQRATKAATQDDTGGQTSDSLTLAPMKAGKTDGELNEWSMRDAARFKAGAKREARAALGYDANHLRVAFEVRDDSPMLNQGNDPAKLFVTGDACDVMLRTNTDATGDKPIPGDMRLLFTELKGDPVCIVYEAKVQSRRNRAPHRFTSPVGQVRFERVEVLGRAEVAIQRDDEGYVLEAAVPLDVIGFTPKAGMQTIADVGVLYSNAGGRVTVQRLYFANQDTAVVDDVPTEARLAPARWTELKVK